MLIAIGFFFGALSGFRITYQETESRIGTACGASAAPSISEPVFIGHTDGKWEYTWPNRWDSSKRSEAARIIDCL